MDSVMPNARPQAGEVRSLPPDLPEIRDLARMYSVMATISVCDARSRAEVRSGTLQAALYPVHGLEAVCGALSVVLDQTDYLVSTYRNLGDAVAKGVALREVIAESAGRATGMSKGKGGPMHLVDTEAGLMPTTGVVGSGLPIAVGLALACGLEGNGRITATTFGDGATATGSYHEALNLASLWKLPVVFVCQNNQWAEHTPLHEHAPATDLAARAAAYALHAESVDGFDAIATWRALQRAVDRCRAGAGPALVECRTYRLTGHSATADFSYMPKTELAAAQERDPVPAFRSWLEAGGLVKAAELAEIDQAARAMVDEAFAFAYASPSPSKEEAQVDVFAELKGAVLR